MIRAVVVDDEHLALQMLVQMLNTSGMAEVAAAFTRPLEALEYLKENKADAVFLDIEMPDMEGLELAGRILDLQENVAIVFVTAYNQYAVEAFRMNALDYLLKPVSTDRLRETLNRIIEEIALPELSGSVAVRCFGKFTVSVGAHEIRFRTIKAEELLAYLINSRGYFVSRSKILDSLWEDFDGDRAIIHFNSTLHYVKKALLPYGIQISILYDRGSYLLDVNSLTCDYLQFCTFVEEYETVETINILEFEETASLYRGEYLSGWECDWATGKRLLLEEKFIWLLLEIARFYMNTGSYQRAVKWLKEGLLHEPLHRELNYRLIEALQLADEQIMAARYYELYRRGLIKRLKLEPDTEFKKLLRML